MKGPDESPSGDHRLERPMIADGVVLNPAAFSRDLRRPNAPKALTIKRILAVDESRLREGDDRPQTLSHQP